MLPLGKWLALAIALSQDASEVVVRGENEALDLMHSGPYEAPFFTFLPKKSLSQCLLLPPNFFYIFCLDDLSIVEAPYFYCVAVSISL